MFLLFALLGCALPLNADADGDGVRMPLDCDDADPAVAPGAGETCGNGVDDDCDGYAAGCGPGGEQPLSTADVRIRADPEAYYGLEELTAGRDATGDGADDVIVAASSVDDSGASVYVLAGPLEGEVALGARTPNVQVAGPRYAIPTVLLSDLDGDGTAELVVAERGESVEDGWVDPVLSVYGDLGRTGLGVEDADAVFSVTDATSLTAPLGDTDGDGREGFVTGVYGADPDDGETGVWLVQGPVAGATDIAEVAERIVGLNDLRSVAGGDIDGDGLDEVVVGGDDALWVVRDGVFEEALRETGASFHDLAIGDTDGDGNADLFTTDWSTNYETSLLFRGPTFGEPVLTVASDADIYSLALPGDIDGDGVGDLLVGTPDGCWSRGCASLYSGTHAGTIDQADALLVGESSNNFAGDLVAGAGDMNLDGTADLLVSARFYSGPAGDRGAAYVLFGGPGL